MDKKIEILNIKNQKDTFIKQLFSPSKGENY
jgi:transcription antitermination factor NusA-like protein